MIKNSNKLQVRALGILGLLIFAPAALWAQNVGSINGHVKDPSGALIPGATVTVTAQSTNSATKVTSQSDGEFVVPNIPPGLYSIAAEASGFKRLVVSNLQLDAGTNLTRDMVLEVGATTTIVNVTGSASLVETTNNTQGTTIDATHILELPLADVEINGLINLTPGVAFVRSSDDISLNRGSNMVGPGLKMVDMLPMIDGVDNTAGDGNLSTSVGYTEIEPPPDVLQEFRVESNNLSAEYSHGALVLVNAVTKAGGNGFHGDVYGYLRNDSADAAGWQPPGYVKPRLQQGHPGGTIGGPIQKNKTFFFAGYEYLFQHIATVASGSQGLLAWRTGDFTGANYSAGGVATLLPIYDPALYVPGQPSVQISCLGVPNKICTNRINPVATNMFTHMLIPNTTPTNPITYQNNYLVEPVDTTDRPFYLVRVDHNFDQNNKLYVRWLYAPQVNGLNTTDAYVYPGWYGGQFDHRNPQNWVLSYTHIFSPTFFADFTFGLQRDWLLTGNYLPNTTTNWGEQILGLGANASFANDQINFTSPDIPYDSASSGVSRLQTETVPSYTVNFTKVKGKHTIKFGSQIQTYNNNYDFFIGTGFSMNGAYTASYTASGATIPHTGFALADFELGYFTSASDSTIPPYGLRFQRYSGYGQDDWRVMKNLTINMGLRYDNQNTPYSPTGVFQSFNPNVPNPGAGTGSIPVGARGATLFQGLNGQGKYLINWRKKDGFEPRFGFAYRVKGSSSTVIRGGFGFIWDNAFGNNLNGALGFSQTISYSYSPNLGSANYSPLLGPATIPQSVFVVPPKSALTPTFGDVGTTFAQSSISYWDPNRVLPYSMEFNFGVQHQWNNILFELGYVGTFSRHVPLTMNINLVPPALLPGLTAGNLASRRPFTEFTGSNASVTQDEDPFGVSDYNALEFRTERRYANGFSWSTALTWSKWISNADPNGAEITTAGDSPGLQDIYNTRGERSLSDSDTPLRFVFSPIVELPFGKGKHFLNQSGVVNGIVGGWETALYSLLQTGSPIGPTVSGGGSLVTGDPNQTIRPNLVAGCNPYSPNKWQPATGGLRGIQYLNPACFVAPATGSDTYGNQPRELSNLLGPGIAQFNMTLGKNFYFKDHYRLQVRVEAVDVFNTPTFNIPNESLNGSNFGIITAYDGISKRIMDFAMKFYF